MSVVAEIIHWVFQLITLVVIVQVILSYFLSPFHPVRQRIDQIDNPLLEPIRRIIPPTGMMDFSPLILIILIQIIDILVRNILIAL